MAFSNGFNGDQKSLGYILQTLEAKQILIPGITSNADLQVSAAGEVAYFYKRDASSVTTGTLGAKITYGSTGVEKVDVVMTKALQIGSVIPFANHNTVGGVSVIADRVIQEAMTAANRWNEEAVAFLEGNAKLFFITSSGTLTTVSATNAALTKTTVYAEVVDMRKAFNLKNKAKGLKPTAVIVSEAVYALLLQSDEFIRKEQAGDGQVVAEGMVGKVAGLHVVVSPDMGTAFDMIMLHAEAVAAPTNVNTLFIESGTAAGYPGGVIIAGEIGYNFKLGDEDLVILRKTAA